MGARAERVLAIDQGTTGTTALVFDDQARVKGRGYSEFPQYFPKPGWVEHDAEEIWASTKRVVRAALKSAKTAAADVGGIGITNQRETLVAWDARTLKPLSRAIVWQCRRTAPDCRELKTQGHEKWVRKKTGLLLDPYFSGTKLSWLVGNQPKVARARRSGHLRFGTIDSWLVARLTEGEVHATDVSNASRTLLFDLKSGAWDEELMELFDARIEELPQIVDSSGVLGHTTRATLGARVPISGLAGDQQSALFGQACFRPGMAKNTYGTGCFALVHAGSKPPTPGAGVLATAAWRLRGRLSYALEGSVFVAGAAVQWLRDGLGIISSASETQALAESVEDTGDVYLVPAFVGLGAPHWDPQARGVLVGITRGTRRAHVARAALESIAYQSADVLDALASSTGRRLRLLRADGGATANGFLMRFQADVLGVPVEVPAMPETTAQGAAFLAGLGCGVWSSLGELESLWSAWRRVEPKMRASERNRLRARWSQAVKRSLAWEAIRPSG
jgi:glycerol kinase